MDGGAKLANTYKAEFPVAGAAYALGRIVIEIDLATSPSAQIIAILEQGLREDEVSKNPGLPPESADLHVAAFCRAADGTICGGIKANVYWDGVEIEILWVAPASRARGHGSALLEKIEAFARAKGAVTAFLKTMDAPGFYQRHGYEIYGVLEDRPIGTKLYHMKKRLD